MKQKTYKRELACVLLIWLGYIVETKDAEVLSLVVWPIFTLTAGAFGIDWYAKSGGLLRKPPEPPNR
jgi:hypothetical protein